MLDRQKLEAIMARRFPGAKHDQVAAAVNAIMGLDEEWEEIVDEELGYHFSPECRNACYLAREVDSGSELRVFRRRAA